MKPEAFWPAHGAGRPAAPSGGAATADGEALEIICIGSVDWLVIHSVAEYTMAGLARSHRVVFVEPFGSVITLARMARLQRRTRVRRPGLEQVAPTMWVYRPPPIGLPGVTRFKAVSALNGLILAALLCRLARRLGFRRPILWSYLYNSAALLRAFPSRLAIYECGDEDSALARDEPHRRRIVAQDRATCRAADLVFAVTAELAEARLGANPHTYEVNCAADLDFFGRARHPETPIPDDMAALPGPRIDYLGGVDPWKIDIALLLFLAEARPHWSFVLVGYIWFGFDRAVFATRPNIHLLGPRDYEAFPCYLKGMDVCMMPFPLNDITRNGDALKLYEYLAGGRPVVSTPVPAARRLSDVVRIADTPQAFLSALDGAIDDTPDDRARRLEAIEAHSWDVRNARKLAVIEGRLDALGRSARP